MKVKRIAVALLALILAISPVVAAPAESAEYTINFAHVVSPNAPKGMAADRFAELIEERSGGRIRVNVFPESQMGTDREITEQMSANIVQMNAPLTSVLTFIIPEFEMFDLPYLFTSREMAYNAVHGELGDIFDKYLADKGFVGLGYWMGEFKQISNNIRPINNVEDLAGLRFRVSQSPILISQFQAVANATSIPFAEIYSSLHTGVVDGLDIPLVNFVTRRFYEVNNHVAITDHGIILYPVIMSQSMYNSLPEDLRLLVHEVLEEVTAYQWEISLEDEKGFVAHLEAEGVQITWFDDAQKQALYEAMRVSYEDFNRMQNGPELIAIAEKYR